jgi:hypothetical protein
MKPNLAKDHGRGPTQPVSVPSIIMEGTSFSSHLSNVPPFDQCFLFQFPDVARLASIPRWIST